MLRRPPFEGWLDALIAPKEHLLGRRPRTGRLSTRAAAFAAASRLVGALVDDRSPLSEEVRDRFRSRRRSQD
jgi:hypothetical protein